MYTGHKGNCVKPSPEPSPVEDPLQPPSFSVANNLNGDNESNSSVVNRFKNTNSSDLGGSHRLHNVMYASYGGDTTGLLESNDKRGKSRSSYLGQNGSSGGGDDSNYKLMPPIPSFNLIDDGNENLHFDATYVQ